MIQGKGFWLWRLSHLHDAGLDNTSFAHACASAGITHVVIKISDGMIDFHTDAEIVELATALALVGVKLWGYSYIYPTPTPAAQALQGLLRAQALGLAGWIIDAEKEYYYYYIAAEAVAIAVNANKNDLPVALSTYRFPDLHQPFPFAEFMACADVAMPQVYWQEAHNPAQQLGDSFDQWQPLLQGKPFVPTGSAYQEHGWIPAEGELTAFLERAQAQFLGANFWRFGHAYTLEGGRMWAEVARFAWDGTSPPPPPPPPNPYPAITCDHPVFITNYWGMRRRKEPGVTSIIDGLWGKGQILICTRIVIYPDYAWGHFHDGRTRAGWTAIGTKDDPFRYLTLKDGE